MIWLFKKIFGIAVTIAVIFFALHLQVGGRQVKDYVTDFWKNPIVQAAVSQGKEKLMGFLNKDVASPDAATVHPNAESTPPMEHIEEDERQELDDVLKDKSKAR